MRSGPPDVVLVVMDCVRQDLFADQLGSGALPFLSTVQGEFLRFSKAVAPASWTIPSHASLFTGRYPWDHGAHYKGGGVLGPALPTIAEYLRDRGYRTTCLSANGYVQPGTGLTRGFEQLRWGGDREFFLRFLAQEPSCPSLNGADAAVHARLERDSSASPLRVGTMRALSRFTPFCDALNRVGGKVKGASPAYVGPWIEREFDRALVDAERQPVFTFVNLLEAHEPYFANAGRPIGARDWLAYARTTQVSEQWTRGEAEPTANDLAWSKRDYLASMQVIDERVGHLVRLLRSHDRWDRTLFVLTSDHGQTFGEGGRMYHRLNLQEEITRIPLWVKFAGAEGRSPGTDDRSWVSLVDLPTTIARSVEPSGAFGDPESVPLQAADRAPNRTVYSLTDGVGPSEGESLPAARRETLDRVQIAGYRGSFKSIVDQSGTEYHFRLTRSGATLVAPDDREFDAAAFADIGLKLRTVLDQRTPTSVSQRIAGWGY
ncbi:MAG: sulfatase-like hydrolase/transferase [Thermoplasmata archaeon]